MCSLTELNSHLILPHRRFFLCFTPPITPKEISVELHAFLLNAWLLKSPLSDPLGISNDLLWREYEYFLEPHNTVKKRSLPPIVACSKRSDSGERHELGKRVKKRGETGRGCPSIFQRLFHLLFSVPLPYSSCLSPLSELLEQATPIVIITAICLF